MSSGNGVTGGEQEVRLGFMDIVGRHADALRSPAEVSKVALAMAQQLVVEATVDQQLAAQWQVYEDRVEAGALAPFTEHVHPDDVPNVVGFLTVMNAAGNPGATGFNYVAPPEEPIEAEVVESSDDPLAALTLEAPAVPAAPAPNTKFVKVGVLQGLRAALWTGGIKVEVEPEDITGADSAEVAAEEQPEAEPTHGKGWAVASTGSHWRNSRGLSKLGVLFTDGTIGVVDAMIDEGEIVPDPASLPLPPAPGQKLTWGVHDPIEDYSAAVAALRAAGKVPEGVQLPESPIGATFRTGKEDAVTATLSTVALRALGSRLPEVVVPRSAAPVAEHADNGKVEVDDKGALVPAQRPASDSEVTA